MWKQRREASRRRPPGLRHGAMVAACVTAWHAAAAGQAPAAHAAAHFSLSWARTEGGDGCISAPELARAVEARLGRRVFVPSTETDVAIEGYVGRASSDGRFHAAFAVADSHGNRAGRRELVGTTENCRDLDANLVLAVALVIDPDAALDDRDDPWNEGPPRRAAPAMTGERNAPRRFALYFGPTVAFGLLPSPAAGAFGRAEWQPAGLWPIALGGGYFVDQTRVIDEQTRVAFNALRFDTTTCPLANHEHLFGYALCAGAYAGFLNASGTGRDGLIVHHRILFAPLLRANVVVSPSRAFSLVFGGTAELPVLRDRFVYRTESDTLAPLFQVAPVSFALEAGLILRPP